MHSRFAYDLSDVPLTLSLRSTALLVWSEQRERGPTFDIWRLIIAFGVSCENATSLQALRGYTLAQDRYFSLAFALAIALTEQLVSEC